MSKEDSVLHGESRRSFIKKSAFSVGATVGLAGCSQLNGEGDGDPTGTDTDTDTDDGDVESAGKALMFNTEFRGGAQFRVVSPVIEQHPDVDGVQEGDFWSDYNTRIIEYLNVDQEVTFFPAHDANIEEGKVYELHDNFSLFSDDTNDEGVVSVKFTEVNEEQAFDADDWNVVEEGGGKALVRWNDYRPGAVFTIVSDIVDWTPRDDVEGTDVFSGYNTRFAEWLNSQDDFQIYVAQDASVESGVNYRMTDEFDVTDPEGNLVTVDLDQVERADGGQTDTTGNQTDGTQSNGNQTDDMQSNGNQTDGT